MNLMYLKHTVQYYVPNLGVVNTFSVLKVRLYTSIYFILKIEPMTCTVDAAKFVNTTGSCMHRKSSTSFETKW